MWEVHFFLCSRSLQDNNKAIVVEQPSILGVGKRSPQSCASMEPIPSPSRAGYSNGAGVTRSFSSSGEKSPDNISSASEAAESPNASEWVAKAQRLI